MKITNESSKLSNRPKRVIKQEKTAKRIFDRLNGSIIYILVESSILIWIFQFIINILFDDHDADAFRTVVPPPISSLDFVVRRFFDGFQRWDSQHYLHISMYGYTFENNLAFFPFFPFLMQNVASLLSYLSASMLSKYTCLLLSGVFINLIGFTAAGYFLYALTYFTFNDINVAVKTTFLFALNPASIFFRTIYTESWFSFLTFLGLHCLRSAFFEKPSAIVQATICFALSSIVRSNGLINFGYVIYLCTCFGFEPFLTPKNSETVTNNASNGAKTKKTPVRFNDKQINALIRYFSILVFCFFVMVLPFCMLQFYQYVSFCTPDSNKIVVDHRVYEMGRSNNYVFPGELKKLPWCKSRFPPPLPYSAVQTRYWNVGLFGYYSFRKIPNFLLASPTFVLALAACVHFLTEMRLSDAGWMKKLLNSKSFAPYILHVLFLSFVGLFMINVEVTTRMIFSSSPLLFWYLCKFLSSTNGDQSVTASMVLERRSVVGLFLEFWRSSEIRGKILLLYFLSYTIVGTALHVNFLPWT